MTIAVIVDHGERLETRLIDTPNDISEEEVLKAIAKELGYTDEELKEDPELAKARRESLEHVQWFAIDPTSVTKLKAIQWPDPYSVSPTFADTVADDNAEYQARVYAAFAKGGPVEVEGLNESEENK